METITRVKQIVELTIKDFNSHGHYIKEPLEVTIKWLSNDLMSIEDIEDYSTIEISLLTLKKLNCLELVNLSFIIETITDDLKDSDNEMIHITIPKVL